ncbi:hypothetical protein AYL99_12003 [Fonsecaea erecta]|uniref:Redoxin domain-containing protein n=1 Tax=Fonsecaea erecta TaxID=1367422 RepID=A0A178Z259_9EURO|nr:hypothetical protein AYL99_12003 [Fonsecaea erecta]OAP53784.1 hypothetical protein AYL99_12003 [Fonsecaea erecta]
MTYSPLVGSLVLIPNQVQQGDSIPDIDLYEYSPGNKVNLAKELAVGKDVIKAFQQLFPGCSDYHVPGYINSNQLKDAGGAFVVSVHEAFVMKAWGKSLDEPKSSGIRFLTDPAGAFTHAWDVELEAARTCGNNRSKRSAVLTENGKISKTSVEPDGTGISSLAFPTICSEER